MYGSLAAIRMLLPAPSGLPAPAFWSTGVRLGLTDGLWPERSVCSLTINPSRAGSNRVFVPLQNSPQVL